MFWNTPDEKCADGSNEGNGFKSDFKLYKKRYHFEHWAL